MLLKNKSFVSLATLTLLIICLVFPSQASPLLRRAATGSVDLKDIDGHIKLTQTDASNIQIEGQFNKGITDTKTDNYAISILGVSKTFTELGIVIVPPGTKPYKNSAPGDLNLLIVQVVTVTHNSDPIASGTIQAQK